MTLRDLIHPPIASDFVRVGSGSWLCWPSQPGIKKYIQKNSSEKILLKCDRKQWMYTCFPKYWNCMYPGMEMQRFLSPLKSY